MFLYRVDLLVSHQGGGVREGLPAFGTRVRPLSGVSFLVDGEGGRVSEGFSAHLTFVGSFSRVDFLVQGQGGEVDEGLPAHRTRVRLLSRVDLHVSVEVGGESEGLPAFRTRVGPLDGVELGLRRVVPDENIFTHVDMWVLGIKFLALRTHPDILSAVNIHIRVGRRKAGMLRGNLTDVLT